MPESGDSLGLLALGCAGLLARRAPRKQTEAAALASDVCSVSERPTQCRRRDGLPTAKRTSFRVGEWAERLVSVASTGQMITH